jgi:hypothetical protein
MPAAGSEQQYCVEIVPAVGIASPPNRLRTGLSQTRISPFTIGKRRGTPTPTEHKGVSPRIKQLLMPRRRSVAERQLLQLPYLCHLSGMHGVGL